MKKNLINALTFVAVATMLFLKANSAPQKGMNDTILDNVEALAMDSEGSGIPWRGHTYNMEGQCCKFIGLWSVECSGVYRAC